MKKYPSRNKNEIHYAKHNPTVTLQPWFNWLSTTDADWSKQIDSKLGNKRGTSFGADVPFCDKTSFQKMVRKGGERVYSVESVWHPDCVRVLLGETAPNAPMENKLPCHKVYELIGTFFFTITRATLSLF